MKTCTGCSGTNKQTMLVQYPTSRTKYKEYKVKCLSVGQDFNKTLAIMANKLALFVHCKNPEPCAGCEYEREDIMNTVWHLLQQAPHG